MLWSRTAETSAIDRLLSRARTGHGGGLLLRGEPGIGKSALLRYADEQAADLCVLQAAGAVAESDLAYAAIHQLLGPLLPRADGLPEPQAAALRIALGLQAGPDAPDPFLVSLAVLTLLSDAGRPVLCLVDDVQWMDGPSVGVLAFVIRRLREEPVVVLAAARPDSGRDDSHRRTDSDLAQAGLPERILGGLDPGEASRLLTELCGATLPPAVRDSLLTAAAGNPLALIELPGTLSPAQLAGTEPLPEPLPLAGELERVFAARVSQLEPGQRTLALLTACSGRLPAIKAAAAALGVGADGLDRLHGLVRITWAGAYAAEGLQLAIEAGQPNLACQHRAFLVEIAAVRGPEDEARRLGDEVLAEATGRGLRGTVALARRALVQLALATGRPDEALVQLEAMWTLGAIVHRGIARHSVPDLVEAAVRAGRPELGAERLPGYLSWAQAAGSAEAGALAARSRALLAGPDQADALFEESLRLHAATDQPMQQARTALLYGEQLRRQRRRVDARGYLNLAADAFGRLGASCWAQRARNELRATGETVRRTDDAGPAIDRLTHQELQVARAVSQGLANREAAAQLFISPRTVDHHLRSIYRSRDHLAGRTRAAGRPADRVLDVGQDPGEQGAHPAGGGPARLDHLGVAETLPGQARRQVGDQRDAEHLRAQVAGRDRLQAGRHPDQVGAEPAQHGDLRRGLVVRAGHHRVDPVGQARVGLAGQRPQPG